LVHWICPAADLDALVATKVRELMSSGPKAVAEAKMLIAALPQRDPDDVRAYTARTIARLRAGEEGQEGLRAFLEKRKPAWGEPA
jgi:methylglutaconyl-CoA hydratase